MSRLSNRVVFVTGASSGIGVAAMLVVFALDWATHGHETPDRMESQNHPTAEGSTRHGF